MTNPTRIELPNGCWWEPHSDLHRSKGYVYNKDVQLVTPLTHDEAYRLAAAMRPTAPVQTVSLSVEDLDQQVMNNLGITSTAPDTSALREALEKILWHIDEGELSPEEAAVDYAVHTTQGRQVDAMKLAPAVIKWNGGAATVAQIIKKALATPSPAAEGSGDAWVVAQELAVKAMNRSQDYVVACVSSPFETPEILKDIAGHIATALRAAKLEGVKAMQEAAMVKCDPRIASNEFERGLVESVNRINALSAEDVGGQG